MLLRVRAACRERPGVDPDQFAMTVMVRPLFEGWMLLA